MPNASRSFQGEPLASHTPSVDVREVLKGLICWATWPRMAGCGTERRPPRPFALGPRTEASFRGFQWSKWDGHRPVASLGDSRADRRSASACPRSGARPPVAKLAPSEAHVHADVDVRLQLWFDSAHCRACPNHRQFAALRIEVVSREDVGEPMAVEALRWSRASSHR
jgi:hypothetical protein